MNFANEYNERMLAREDIRKMITRQGTGNSDVFYRIDV